MPIYLIEPMVLAQVLKGVKLIECIGPLPLDMDDPLDHNVQSWIPYAVPLGVSAEQERYRAIETHFIIEAMHLCWTVRSCMTRISPMWADGDAEAVMIEAVASVEPDCAP
jgi:hypothetical protein